MKLGFGTWQIGGECTFGGRQTGWGQTDIKEAKLALQFGIDSGINFFDTAPGYGKGDSEKILGEVFAQNKSKEIKVCTKYGSIETAQGEAILDFSNQAVLKSVEESLARLKVDYIDTLLLHGPPDDFDYTNFDNSGLEKLKAVGKIKNYGVSVRSLKGAINVVSNGFGDAVEAIYNILDRRVEDYIFEQSNFSNYNFIGRVPLASGFLSEKYLTNPDVIFAPTDIRNAINEHDRLWYKNSLQNLSFLNDLPGGISVSALRYVLFETNVTQIIPGMRTRKQVENNLLAISLGALSSEIIDKIKISMPSTNPKWLF